jgi:hypothetical protein
MVALIQCSALVSALMPNAWVDMCAELMGVEPLPHTPLAGYLARLSSMMYVVHGATLFIVANQLPQSIFMVRPLGWVTLALGAAMLWIDWIEQMPAIWTWIEFLAITINGLVMILLAGKSEGVDRKSGRTGR